MKILLTGKDGQVGWELSRSLSFLGKIYALGRDDMDLSKHETLTSVIQDIKPDLIINAAAYTNVDKAESEPDQAMIINGIAPKLMALEAKKIGAEMIHFSTDFVFDGNTTKPYTEDRPTCPLNVYGETKLEGEKGVQLAGIPYIIFRTGWVYSMRGNNFLLTMQKMAQEKKQVRVVNDQIGGPTWSKAIAEGITNILKKNLVNTNKNFKILPSTGIFNISCGGETSWFEFAKMIFNLSGLENTIELIPIPTEQYPTPATRPKYSLLSNEKLKKVLNYEMPHWKNALKECLSFTK